MSIRYFGEYLISKGAISSSDLANALIIQTKELPNLAELTLDEGMLTPDEVIKVFHIQQEHGLSFLWALNHLGGNFQRVAKKLENLIEEKRTPLGQILLSLSIIDLKSLTMMLDDYLSQAETPQEETKSEETVVDSSQEDEDVQKVLDSVSDDEINDVVSSILPEGEDLTYPEGMLAELESLFEERKYRAVKVALSFVKDKNIPDAKVISKLIGDVTKILQPVAKFTSAIGLRHMKALLVHMQEKTDLLQDPSLFEEDQIRGIAANLSLCNEELWKLRNLVCTQFSEEKYTQLKENRDAFSKALRGDG